MNGHGEACAHRAAFNINYCLGLLFKDDNLISLDFDMKILFKHGLKRVK